MTPRHIYVKGSDATAVKLRAELLRDEHKAAGHITNIARSQEDGIIIMGLALDEIIIWTVEPLNELVIYEIVEVV